MMRNLSDRMLTTFIAAVFNLYLNQYKVLGRMKGQSSGPHARLLTAVVNWITSTSESQLSKGILLYNNMGDMEVPSV